MLEPIRILIADDHEIIRDGLRLILEDEEDFAVIGEAADGLEVVRLADELQPNVVLMDMRMPGANAALSMGGLEAIAQILAHQPKVAIVILTTYNEDDLMLQGLRAGACGFLLKDTKRQILFDSLRAAAKGEVLLSPEILARVVGARSTERVATDSSPSLGEVGLTDREREVLHWVALGERSKEIAVRLGISERTVKAYLSSIYTKLGVDSRAAAIAVASRRGLWRAE